MTIRQADLITLAYQQSQVALHARPEGYGTRGDRWASTVLGVATERDCWSVLDYGCGQGSLGRALRGSRVVVREYDPGVATKTTLPSFADLVVAIDVLEHIEPSCLGAVLRHIRMLARKAVFVVISTRPSRSVLPDGRNAHLIIETDEWWRATVESAGFTVQADPDIPSTVKRPAHAWIAVLTP